MLAKKYPHFKNSAPLVVFEMEPEEAYWWGVFLMCNVVLGTRKLNQI